MYFKKLFFIPVIMSVLASCSTNLTKITGVQGDHYQQMHRDLDKNIPKLLKQKNVASMVVLVIDDQQIVYANGFGYADREGQLSALPDTVYSIGSISKLFTATAIMQLQERGKVDIDKPLHTYLPEFSINTPYGQEGITLRRIMTHHSGLPSDYDKGFSRYSASETLLTDLANDYIAFKPGTVHSYSNLGYGLLGRVIEEVSGLSYEQYLQQYIFQPLKMKNAFVGIQNSLVMARAYEENKRQQPIEIRDRAAGDINMSANDLALFAKAMLQYTSDDLAQSSTLLTNDSVNEMWHPQNEHIVLDGGLKMGLGWILSYPDEGLETMQDLAWHNGSTIYYHSSLMMNRKEKLAVIVLSNSAEAATVNEEVANNTLLAAMASKSGYTYVDYEPPGKRVTQFTPEQVAILSGRYLSSSLGDFTIEGNVNKLRAVVDGLPITLLPMNDGTLSINLRLFGLIPLNTKESKNVRLQTIEHEGQQLIRVNNGPAIAQKVTDKILPEYCEVFLGSYHLVNPDPLHDRIGLKILTLSEANGYIKAELKMKKETSQLFFDVVNEQRAKVIGYDRSLGGSAIFQTDEKGRQVILYSGLKFIKD